MHAYTHTYIYIYIHTQTHITTDAHSTYTPAADERPAVDDAPVAADEAPVARDEAPSLELTMLEIHADFKVACSAAVMRFSYAQWAWWARFLFLFH